MGKKKEQLQEVIPATVAKDISPNVKMIVSPEITRKDLISVAMEKMETDLFTQLKDLVNVLKTQNEYKRTLKNDEYLAVSDNEAKDIPEWAEVYGKAEQIAKALGVEKPKTYWSTGSETSDDCSRIRSKINYHQYPKVIQDIIDNGNAVIMQTYIHRDNACLCFSIRTERRHKHVEINGYSTSKKATEIVKRVRDINAAIIRTENKIHEVAMAIKDLANAERRLNNRYVRMMLDQSGEAGKALLKEMDQGIKSIMKDIQGGGQKQLAGTKQ